MEKTSIKPNYIFETSWEVCNKVGGIYTVLSTRAKTMCDAFPEKVFFIGPDLGTPQQRVMFDEDKTLLRKWRQSAEKAGIGCKVGRWNVPGNPIVLLVDYKQYLPQITDIYGKMWEMAQIDSLHGYGDYEESSLFSYAAGVLVEHIVKTHMKMTDHVIYQAHEWMAAMGMLYLQQTTPQVGTIFTTHATSVGRSITSNDKLLYKYFDFYNGDQMAAELNVESKHSNERQAAWGADCFTTVSDFTARECRQLLGKEVDVVLENGFENDFVPQGSAFTSKRKKARAKIMRVANALLGEEFDEQTLIVSTSGRNDYRSKGFDVLFEALARLSKQHVGRKVLALVEVPCWVKAPRVDLQERLAAKAVYDTSLTDAYVTHTLHNFYEDRILNTMRSLGLTNEGADNVRVILIPCYLDGADGIFDMEYYDLLIGNDLCLYPSYYEPWGYTPLESMAFKIPCVTTDLSGFGQWADKVLGKAAKIEDGVYVIPRNDDNYDEVAQAIVQTIVTFAQLVPTKVNAVRKKAATLAAKALWHNFITKYHAAYDVALSKAAKRKIEL